VILDDYTLTVAVGKAKVQETRIRVLLQPKPKWLPAFAWRSLIARLLYIEESSCG
jgi:hypothetical protein